MTTPFDLVKPEVEATPAPPEPAPAPKSWDASLTVPMMCHGTSYCGRSLDFSLPASEAQTLARIRTGLDNAEAKLKSGKLVKSKKDAVVWLLEKLGG